MTTQAEEPVPVEVGQRYRHGQVLVQIIDDDHPRVVRARYVEHPTETLVGLSRPIRRDLLQSWELQQ